MPFLPPSQQCQSTEGINKVWKAYSINQNIRDVNELNSGWDMIMWCELQWTAIDEAHNEWYKLWTFLAVKLSAYLQHNLAVYH